MLFFIYGQDTFRSRQKLSELKKKFRHDVDPGGNSLIELDGENATASAFHEAVAAHSLFTKRRMVVVENIFKNKSKTVQEEIAGHLERSMAAEEDGQGNIIIFWDETDGKKPARTKLFKLLSKPKPDKKNAHLAQKFDKLSNTEAIEWVRRQADARGARIKRDGAVHLTGLFGSDLWQLNNELEKIISYKRGVNQEIVRGGGRVDIALADIRLLCRGQADENIFALTDAISQKNKAKAMELLQNELEAGTAENYLLYMIARQFRILLQVRQALDQGHGSRKIMGDLKLHPFVAQKAISQVRSFTTDDLKVIFRRLLEMESQFKQGRIDLKSALNILIATI